MAVYSSDADTKKDGQCMYYVAFQHVHVTIAAMEKR